MSDNVIVTGIVTAVLAVVAWIVWQACRPMRKGKCKCGGTLTEWHPMPEMGPVSIWRWECDQCGDEQPIPLWRRVL